MDIVSIIALISFFLVALLLGYFLLATFKLNKAFYLKCMLLSLIGHYIGGLFFYWVTSNMPADTHGYFAGASPIWKGDPGMGFVMYIIWWLRYLFFSDSYLGTYAFFITLGFFASMFYAICFRQLFLRMVKCDRFNIDVRNFKWGFLLIACLPSALFWASAMGKDSLCYFSLALVFLSIVQIQQNKLYLCTLLFGATLGFLVRPYLAIVGVGGFFLWQIFRKKRCEGFFLNLLLILIVIVGFSFVSDIVAKFCVIDYSPNSIAQKAISQQQWLVGGTSVPMPTSNPKLLLLVLPYLMFVNLFLPVFFLARNAIGMLASFQNLLLIILCYQFIKHWNGWKKVQDLLPVTGYMFWFFIFGLALLAMINTNLGLADREKLMYLPAFLIGMLLTLTIKKDSTTKQYEEDICYR